MTNVQAPISINIPQLDRQIEILLECKPLAENEVKDLCEKVQ